MKSKKPRCSICRATFTPKPTTGKRQKTCSPKCSKERHRRKCSNWNKKHRHLGQEDRVEKAVEKIKENITTSDECGKKPASGGKIHDRELVILLRILKDALGAQVTAIIALTSKKVVKLALRRVKSRSPIKPDG